ncbi:MAG: M12 family metallopeptidase [Cystobacter sp.]
MTRLPALLASALVLSACGPESASNEKASAPLESSDDALYASRTLLWPRPNATIPVCWENPAPEHAQERQATRDALAETWERYGKLRFTGFGACSASTPGTIRITVDSSHPRSAVGYRSRSATPMWLNFNNWCDKRNANYYWTCIKFVSVHEFGHAIGFQHEQDRLDTPQWCKDQQVGSVNTGSGDWQLGDWDASSIMNYCNKANYQTWLLSPTDQWAVGVAYPATL